MLQPDLHSSPFVIHVAERHNSQRRSPTGKEPPRKLLRKIRVHPPHAPRRSQVKTLRYCLPSHMICWLQSCHRCHVLVTRHPCTYCVYRTAIGQGTASLAPCLGAVKFRSTSSAIHSNHCGEARGPEIKQIIKKSKFGMLTLPLLSSANFSLRRCGLPAATFPDTHFPSTWWFPRKQRNVRLRFIGDMVLCTSLFCCHFQTCNRADNGFLRHIVEPTTASSDTAYSSRFR